MTTITQNIPDILNEYKQSSGNNTYRKLGQVLANDTGYPTPQAIHKWANGAKPDRIKLEVILTRVQTEEARELVRALLAVLEE